MSLYELLVSADMSQNQEVLEKGYSIGGVDPSLTKISETALEFENPVTGELMTTHDPLELKQWQEAYSMGDTHFESYVTSYQATVDDKQRAAATSKINKELAVAEENWAVIPEWMWAAYAKNPKVPWATVKGEVKRAKPSSWIDSPSDRKAWTALFQVWMTCSSPYLKSGEATLPYFTRAEVGDAELCSAYNSVYEDPQGELWSYTSWTDIDLLKASLDPRFEDLMELQNEQNPVQDESIVSLPKYNAHHKQLRQHRDEVVSRFSRQIAGLDGRVYANGKINKRLENLLTELERADKGTPFLLGDLFPEIDPSLSKLRLHQDSGLKRTIVHHKNQWFMVQETTSGRKLTQVNEVPVNPSPLVKFNAELTKSNTQALKAALVFKLVKQHSMGLDEAISLAYSWSTPQGARIRLQSGQWLAYIPHTDGTNVPWSITKRYTNTLKKTVAIEMKKPYTEILSKGFGGETYVSGIKVDTEVIAQVNKRIEALVIKREECKQTIIKVIQDRSQEFYENLLT